MLKPCPLCNSKAEYDWELAEIRCTECQLALRNYVGFEKVWNKRSQWISVDAPPETFDQVLVQILYDDGSIEYETDRWVKSEGRWFYHYDKKINYWQPITPPKEK